MSSLASTHTYLNPAAGSAAEDPTKTYKGFKFIFAINASTKPGENVWSIPNRRFMLTEPHPTKLFGQYITSNWYSKQYSKGTCIRFAVLMVEAGRGIATVEKDLNSLNNPFPTVFDIPPYVKKFSFFDLTPNLLDSCILCANQKGSFTFTMRATNCNWDMLHLHIYKDGPNTCIISQPEFEIMKPF